MMRSSRLWTYHLAVMAWHATGGIALVSDCKESCMLCTCTRDMHHSHTMHAAQAGMLNGEHKLTCSCEHSTTPET